ncbi:MAG: putative 4-hydroxybenzoate polyprenyltransferase [Verrucomicrobiae bacterium]|nr:putative 4-hydroxybenzoate polyprenyltransferase [Verrucomicrobiae bacterium]
MSGLRRYFEFVRFSHTVFALPFALASMVVAADGWPGLRTFLLIVAAMVGARTAAMGFNRIVDRRFDALNPRTADRHLPTGKISLGAAWVLTLLSAVGFIIIAGFINWICFVLSPLALAIVFFYSVTKRFTDFTHFFLGLSLAVAPVGGWLAVRSGFDWSPLVLALAVIFWLTGFDIIYATQDYQFDKSVGLHSLPVRWGIVRSLRFARWMHVCMWLALNGFGWVAGLGWPYYGGLAVIAVCLVYEHWLAMRGDPVSVNVASLRVNGVVSVVFLVAVVTAVAMNGH